MGTIVVPKNATFGGQDSDGNNLWNIDSEHFDMDLILEEAKRRYPEGTTVICLYDNIHYKIKSKPYIPMLQKQRIMASTDVDKTSVVLYSYGGWAEIITDIFKIGDFVTFEGTNGNENEGIVFYVTENIVECVYCRNVDTANRGGAKLSNKGAFEAQLEKINLKFNYETLETEPLDEFADLPQKIEDLNTSIEGLKISEIKEKFKNYPSINKYSEAIQVQPNILRLYEAWKDEVDYSNGMRKYCIILSNNRLNIDHCYTDNRLFVFKTQAKAERFLELFRTELELYKPLMGGL